MGNIGMRMDQISNSRRAKAEASGRDIIPEGYSAGKMKQFTPEQMELFKSSFSHLGPDSYLSKLAMGDEDTMNEMEAPAMRQFSGMQGQLASRFSGMGMGGRKSSGFQNTSNQATSDFAQDLQSKRMGLRSQAIKDLMGMSNELMGQRPYERFLTKKGEEESPYGIPGAVVGGVAGFAAGGPSGAAQGAKWGYQAGNAL